MKKKVKVRFDDVKIGDCLKLIPKGPIYIKDDTKGGVVRLTNHGMGQVRVIIKSRLVIPTKVKIVEAK